MPLSTRRSKGGKRAARPPAKKIASTRYGVCVRVPSEVHAQLAAEAKGQSRGVQDQLRLILAERYASLNGGAPC